MERLVLLLAQSEASGAAQPQPDVYVVNRGSAAEAAALVLARGLRQQGLSVELDAGGSAVGKQFKRADRSGAAWAVVLGDEEMERGVLRLKPLRDPAAEERTLDLRDWTAAVALVRP
jgi:histidyl-tRNA synthetase